MNRRRQMTSRKIISWALLPVGLLTLNMAFTRCSSSSESGQSFSGLEGLSGAVPSDNEGFKSFEDIQKKREELQKNKGDKKEGGTTNQQDIAKPQETSGPLPTYGSFFDRTFGKVIYAHFSLQKNANDDFPIILDLVFVYKDAAAYTALRNVTNGTWFNHNNQALQNVRRNPNIDVHSFEFPPEERSMKYLIEVRGSAIGALLFNRMNGFSPDYAIVVDPYQNLHFAAQGGQFGVYSGN